MPKQRITKEMVIEAAFELAREGGMENVMVKNIAERLGCSVQPVYCYCSNMEGLKREVIDYTGAYLRRYVKERMDKDSLFQSVGIAHADFARSEPHLYRLYFLRERSGIHSFDDLYEKETDPQIAKSISRELGIPLTKARELHLNMLIYNTGMSFILSVLGSDTEPEQVARFLTQAKSAFTEFIVDKHD